MKPERREGMIFVPGIRRRFFLKRFFLKPPSVSYPKDLGRLGTHPRLILRYSCTQIAFIIGGW